MAGPAGTGSLPGLRNLPWAAESLELCFTSLIQAEGGGGAGNWGVAEGFGD